MMPPWRRLEPRLAGHEGHLETDRRDPVAVPERSQAPGFKITDPQSRHQLLLRGGLTIGLGIITGNLTGFARVALTAYLLGTQSRADSLAVAVGPMDTLNSLLINSMVFAFVPMLTACTGADRVALFRKLNRIFGGIFASLSLAIIVFAPGLIHILAPGIDPAYYWRAVGVLRIVAVSTLAAGLVSLHSALLYTDRRFGPSAFYQASLNVLTVIGALALWKSLGVYAFAIGYAVGAWVQVAVVHVCVRSSVKRIARTRSEVNWRDILSRPVYILLYAGLLASNVTFTRAWATHYGPGMAAALDYCMRGVAVPLALLVSPMSNSLLPEIARLRSQLRLREAYRLIDRTVALAALAAVAICAVAITLRVPAIQILFQRGSFTADSTRLVAAAFLGLGPSLIGWSLIELTSRALFALDRPLLPVLAGGVPVLFNVIYTLSAGSLQPQLLGLGASLGALCGFLFLLFLWRSRRHGWAA